MEVELYLSILSVSSHPGRPVKLAVIKVGGAVLE
jgi:hypothetical protein